MPVCMLVCAIIFSVARNQNCSCSYVSIENHVFGTILGYFSKPLETGKLPNLPSEIRVKLGFWHAFHFCNPSRLTCSQPGARTQSIVFMPACMPVCAIVFSAVRNQNCFFFIAFDWKPCIWNNFGILFKTPRNRKTAKRPFWNRSEASIFLVNIVVVVVVVIVYMYSCFWFNQRLCSQPLCPDALPLASAGVGRYIMIWFEDEILRWKSEG